MDREQAIACIKAAGVKGDRDAFIQIKDVNRVPNRVASKAYNEGREAARLAADVESI